MFSSLCCISFPWFSSRFVLIGITGTEKDWSEVWKYLFFIINIQFICNKIMKKKEKRKMEELGCASSRPKDQTMVMRPSHHILAQIFRHCPAVGSNPGPPQGPRTGKPLDYFVVGVFLYSFFVCNCNCLNFLVSPMRLGQTNWILEVLDNHS